MAGGSRELALSRATVSRVLRRAGLNRPRSLAPPLPVIRYEDKRPGDSIQSDIKRLARIVNPAGRHHRRNRLFERGRLGDLSSLSIGQMPRVVIGQIPGRIDPTSRPCVQS
jgi:hypothetical protein